MEILKYITLIYQKFDLFIIVSTRISGLLTVFLLFRRDFVNTRTLIALTTLLSIFVLLFNPTIFNNNEVFSAKMLFICTIQFFIGFMAGLILNIAFEIFNAVGQLVSMQVGLSIDSLFDPRLGSITGLTKFYSMCLLLTFMLLNGHLVILKMILDSFTALPIDHYYIPRKLLTQLIQYSSVIFIGSVGIAITVIVAMILVNVSLAVMTRFAPQFNVFTIGTSLTLVLGIVCVYVSFHFLMNKGAVYLTQAMDFIDQYYLRIH